MGDSSSWGFPKFYAEYLEADLGVTVTMLDWTRGGITSAAVVDQLRSDKQERLDVSQSQVVSFYGSPLHIPSLSITPASTATSTIARRRRSPASTRNCRPSRT